MTVLPCFLDGWGHLSTVPHAAVQTRDIYMAFDGNTGLGLNTDPCCHRSTDPGMALSSSHPQSQTSWPPVNPSAVVLFRALSLEMCWLVSPLPSLTGAQEQET